MFNFLLHVLITKLFHQKLFFLLLLLSNQSLMFLFLFLQLFFVILVLFLLELISTSSLNHIGFQLFYHLFQFLFFLYLIIKLVFYLFILKSQLVIPYFIIIIVIIIIIIIVSYIIIIITTSNISLNILNSNLLTIVLILQQTLQPFDFFSILLQQSIFRVFINFRLILDVLSPRSIPQSA